MVVVSGTSPFGNAVHALTVGDGGIVSLGDSVTRKIDETFDSSRGLRVLDIAADGTETVVSYALVGSSVSQTRTMRFDTPTNAWRLLGADADHGLRSVRCQCRRTTGARRTSTRSGPAWPRTSQRLSPPDASGKPSAQTA